MIILLFDIKYDIKDDYKKPRISIIYLMIFWIKYPQMFNCLILFFYQIQCQSKKTNHINVLLNETIEILFLKL